MENVTRYSKVVDRDHKVVVIRLFERGFFVCDTLKMAGALSGIGVETLRKPLREEGWYMDKGVIVILARYFRGGWIGKYENFGSYGKDY